MKKFKCKATVIYFNKLSGDGMVELIDITGMNIQQISACNIKGKKTWFPETACVYYEKHQVIDVEVKYDSHALFVIGLTPGHIDQDKWDSLDKDNLAFKCAENGEAITGLFK